jgi:hypothetical protein
MVAGMVGVPVRLRGVWVCSAFALLACSSASNGPGTSARAGSDAATKSTAAPQGSGGASGTGGASGASTASGKGGAGGASTPSGSGGAAAGSGGAVASSGSGGSDQVRPPPRASDAGSAHDSGAGTDAGSSGMLALPPVNAKFDYQLGGAYPPPSGVMIVTRDRTEQPASGLYNICYINGFQIQSGEMSMWTSQHPDLILRDSGGNPVVDSDWNETLIDVSTADKRTAVAGVIGDWIAGCKKAGFDAVEIDNLDSYSRSSGLLTEDDNVAAIALFAKAAHAQGMPIAQKNSSELVPRRAEMGTDFSVAEECNRYSECDSYTSGYGDHVLVIEYQRSDFMTGCTKYPNLSIVLRDVDLVTPSDSAYVYDGC